MSAKRNWVEIKGQVYTVTENEWGWQVTCNKDTSRTYAVFRACNGAPARCSCPSFVHRGGICKHMEAVLDLQMPSWTPENEECE
jgi:uncharacterized Zn finger protein